jgi:DDE superfamily endonuclease
LCLFGDNAYINSPFLATPYSGTKGGIKDAYNFYHSQLRINIECAFGRFVHRWGILRSPIPQNITLKKTIALVVSLAKLHNYCTDEADIAAEATVGDNFSNRNNGSVRMVFSDDADMDLPEGLLYGGHHRDDMPSNSSRSHSNRSEETLPREILLSIVETKNLKRPTPMRRRH